MKLHIFILLCCCCYFAESYKTTEKIKQDIIKYLVDYGYLQSSTYTKQEFRKSLRQLQRDYNFLVTGNITPEVVHLIKRVNDQEMVVEYLKTFGYIQPNNIGDVEKLSNAIKSLQRNSGTLNITGTINSETINFIKSHPNGYSEGLFA